eukprot:6209365-Pleurochrysis_carterae.AAC.1
MPRMAADEASPFIRAQREGEKEAADAHEVKRLFTQLENEGTRCRTPTFRAACNALRTHRARPAQHAPPTPSPHGRRTLPCPSDLIGGARRRGSRLCGGPERSDMLDCAGPPRVKPQAPARARASPQCSMPRSDRAVARTSAHGMAQRSAEDMRARQPYDVRGSVRAPRSAHSRTDPLRQRE